MADAEGEVAMADVLGHWCLQGQTPTRATLGVMVQARCVEYEYPLP